MAEVPAIADDEMTRGEHALKAAADRLEGFTKGNDRQEVLRRLRPKLLAARKRPEQPKQGPNPWLVVGVAFAVGFAAAKVLDWRGHAHPRR